MLEHLAERVLDHYRPETLRNASGGLDETRVPLGQIEVRASQPSAEERSLARTAVGPQQGQAELEGQFYTEPDEDVARGDELEDPVTGEAWRVVATLAPSRPVYLRLDVAAFQPEPTEGVS